MFTIFVNYKTDLIGFDAKRARASANSGLSIVFAASLTSDEFRR